MENIQVCNTQRELARRYPAIYTWFADLAIQEISAHLLSGSQEDGLNELEILRYAILALDNWPAVVGFVPSQLDPHPVRLHGTTIQVRPLKPIDQNAYKNQLKALTELTFEEKGLHFGVTRPGTHHLQSGLPLTLLTTIQPKLADWREEFHAHTPSQKQSRRYR